MKLIELLSRYLSGGRPLRSRRNRTRFDQAASALTQTDGDLERRLLLSATSDPQQSPEPIPVESVAGVLTISSVSVDSFDRLTISLDDGADFYVTSGFAVVTPQSEGTTNRYTVVLTASPSVAGTETQYRVSLSDSISQLLKVDNSNVAADRDGLEFEFNDDRVVDSLNNQIIDFGQRQPISKDLLAELLTPGPEDSSRAAESSTPPAAGTGIAPSSRSDEAALADDVSNATASDLVTDSTDLFFSIVHTPLWNVDADDSLLSLPDNASTAGRSNRRQISTAGIESARKRSEERQQSQSLDQSAGQSRKQTSGSHGRSTDVFTTSESKTAFARLLNSLVQFDTAEFLDGGNKLADWLSEQFDLGAEDSGSGDFEATSTNNTSYADTTEAAQHEQRNERLQQAYLKIDYLQTSVAALTILSDHSPEPPEIAGIWQRICFECNPRGPPVSDIISGSDFDQVEAGRIQLQQLRYSISPRGPSVVSVN